MTAEHTPLPIRHGADAGRTLSWRCDEHGIATIINLLREEGFEVIGPRRGEHAIEYGSIVEISDLPRGVREVQDKGRYRLEERGDGALFGYTVGPHSWKQFLFPPREQLWEVDLINITIRETPTLAKKRAFFGVRTCDAYAIAIQDRVFLGPQQLGHLEDGTAQDARYASRRATVVLIGVNCTESASTCFCGSMGTGPKHQCNSAGGPSTKDTMVDIVITELLEDETISYLLEASSEWGVSLLGRCKFSQATQQDLDARDRGVAQAIAMQQRAMSPDVQSLLMKNLSSPYWQKIAERCLSCANCTLVCPTCFCHSVQYSTDLAQTSGARSRRWESCFTAEHSYMVGGPVRRSTASRYRQWLTHKLATWHDQFGVSGCTGCGRCITWCPVGIDLTEEVKAVAAVTPKDSANTRTRDDSGLLTSIQGDDSTIDKITII